MRYAKGSLTQRAIGLKFYLLGSLIAHWGSGVKPYGLQVARLPIGRESDVANASCPAEVDKPRRREETLTPTAQRGFRLSVFSLTTVTAVSIPDVEVKARASDIGNIDGKRTVGPCITVT